MCGQHNNMSERLCAPYHHVPVTFFGIQGPKKWFAERDKHYPSRSGQTSLATAGANFTKPRTSHFFGLCILLIRTVNHTFRLFRTLLHDYVDRNTALVFLRTARALYAHAWKESDLANKAEPGRKEEAEIFLHALPISLFLKNLLRILI